MGPLLALLSALVAAPADSRSEPVTVTVPELPGRHVVTSDSPRGLALSPSGRRLFVASEKTGLFLTDWQDDPPQLLAIPAPLIPGDSRRSGAGAAVAGFSPDERTLYWISAGGSFLRVLDTTTGALLGSLSLDGTVGHHTYTHSLAVDLAVGPDGRHVFVVDDFNRRILVVDAVAGQVVASIESNQPAPSLALGGSTLFGADLGPSGPSNSYSILGIDVTSPADPLPTLEWRMGVLLGDAAAGRTPGQIVANTNSLVAAGGNNDLLVRFDLTTRRLAAVQRLAATGKGAAFRNITFTGLALSPDNRFVYAAQAGLNAVTVLRAEDLAVVGHLPTAWLPYRIVVSPQGRHLAWICVGGLGNTASTAGVLAPPNSGLVTILDRPTTDEIVSHTPTVLARNSLTAIAELGPGLLDPPPPETPTNPDPTETEPGSDRITLPIEVLGPRGTFEEVRLVLSETESARAKTLYLLTHGLQYDNKALVTINGLRYLPINSSSPTIRVLGNARLFGGIGGGFATIPLEIDLPDDALRPGTNTIRFTYIRKDSYAVSGFRRLENRIDDASSGFRVLAFNLRDGAGTDLLPKELFVEDDPRTWGPPPVTGSLEKAIQEGEWLWRGQRPDGTRFQLLNHSEIGLTPERIWASCSDCHAQDGRDLKYYNYSNRSIIARSRIHGLTSEEGSRIAAFIRTLPDTPVVPQARPWNPPFQPGPGLDSKPVYEWPAGAGIEAVVEDPADTFNYIFPGAYTTGPSGDKVWDLSKITPDPIRPKANLSMREAPIPYQLPDWNHWLPKAHPIDAYADQISTNAAFRTTLEKLFKLYSESPTSLRHYASIGDSAAVVTLMRGFFYCAFEARASYPFETKNHTLKEAQRRYALGLLPLVKAWEIHMEFGLSDTVALDTCGPRADARSWRLGTALFAVSPNMAGTHDTREPGVPYQPFNGSGIGNNSELNFTYFSAAWYHTQLILDHGNRSPACGVSAGAPYDWPYVMSVQKHLQFLTEPAGGLTTMPMMYLYLSKGFQVFDTDLGVDRGNYGGWNPNAVNPWNLHFFTFGSAKHQKISWEGIPFAARARLFEVLHRVWLDRNKESTPDQYRVPTIGQVPHSAFAFVKPGTRLGREMGETLGDRVHAMLSWRPRGYDGTLTGFGVSAQLQEEYIDWAKTIWPLNGDGTPVDWDSLRPSYR